MSASIRAIAKRIWIPARGTRRLFLAVPATTGWRETLVRLRKDLTDSLGEDESFTRWVPPENYHITVRFIGAVDRLCVPDLTKHLAHVLAEEKGFTLPFSGIRIATPSDPKMIWIVFRDIPAFSDLVREVSGSVSVFLRNECNGMVLQNGHDIVPHITLARMKHGIRMRTIGRPPYIPDALTVTRVILYESETRPTGSVYREIKRFRLPLSGNTGV